MLPPGLVINGSLVLGGGDSLFVSVHRPLSQIIIDANVPDSHVELRVQLVDELITNPNKYNLKLDQESRKELKLMRCRGQLQSLDVLLAASRLYKVRIFVYFWSIHPIIYQYRNYPHTIHLQCISGIHFNPLIEVVNYQLPDLSQYSFNSIYFSAIDMLCPPAELIADEFEDSFVLPELIDPCIVDSGIPCDHSFSFLPQIYVSVSSQKFCAIFDTGAEISRVSLSAVMRMSD